MLVKRVPDLARFPEHGKKTAIELINQFEPNDLDRRNIWSGGKLYAMNIVEKPDSYVLLFLRSWQEGESYEADDELEAVEATYIKDTKRFLSPLVVGHFLTGSAAKWMDEGEFHQKYVSRE